MMTALLVLHLMIAAGLVGVVLLQRSEGGALGIGGGGGFLSGRGQANLLTRITAALAGCFFLTSILLTVLAKQTAPQGSAFDAKPPASSSAPAAPATSGAPATTDGAAPAPGPAPADAPKGGILDKLK